MSYQSGLTMAAQTLPVGAVYVAQILHDADCPKLRDGECQCDADIQIQTAKVESR